MLQPQSPWNDQIIRTSTKSELGSAHFLMKPRHELRAQRIGIHGPRSLKPDFIVLCQFRGAGPWGNQGDDSLIRSWMVRLQVLRPVGLFDLCISACWALSVGRPPEVWATKARPPKIFPEGPLEQIVLVWGPCKSFWLLPPKLGWVWSLS